MGGEDGDRWEDDQLMTLLTGLADDPEADFAEGSTSAAPDDPLAELALEDVVAAGRAACCWLEAVVTVRDLARLLGPAAEPSAGCEPGHQFGHSSTGSTTT